MKRKNETLYNLFFPVWLLFLHPLLIAAALPINFGIDLLVVYLALRAMKIESKKDLLRKKVWRTWLFGFAADAIGAVILLILSQISATYDVFGHDLYLNPFRSAPALLIMLAVMTLVGFLIYLFNRKFVYRNTDLTDRQQHLVCLALAIATTPYFYLLPTAWFVI
jgi:hypothetical protein